MSSQCFLFLENHIYSFTIQQNKKLFFFAGPKIISQNWKKLLETNFDSVGQ